MFFSAIEMKRQSPPPSSSAAAAEIEGHEDLLYEILILLPPKILIKFKAVSPRWRSLISAPTFCRRHALHHHRRDTQHSLLIQSQEGPNYLVSSCTNPRLIPRRFPFGDRSTVRVEHSCNGLLLLRVETESDLYSRRFYVFNPTTSQKRNLAPLPRDAYAIRSMYLIFDPSLSPHYKVFCFVGRWEPIYIYSSETQRWMRTRHRTEKLGMRFDDGVYFNGLIFLPLDHDDYGYYYYDYESPWSSIFVGRDGHVSDVPYLPQRDDDEGAHKDYAMESNGVAFCVTLYWYFMGAEVCVQEMKEMESGWSKRYTNCLRPVLSACSGKDYFSGRGMELIGVIHEDEDLLLLLLVYEKIVRYRLSDGGFDVAVDYGSQEFMQETKEWPYVGDFDVVVDYSSQEFMQETKERVDLAVGDAHHFMQTLAPV